MIGYGKLTSRLTLAPKHRWANWAKAITAMPITTENERMGLNDLLNVPCISVVDVKIESDKLQ